MNVYEFYININIAEVDNNICDLMYIRYYQYYSYVDPFCFSLFGIRGDIAVLGVETRLSTQKVNYVLRRIFIYSTEISKDISHKHLGRIAL